MRAKFLLISKLAVIHRIEIAGIAHCKARRTIIQQTSGAHVTEIISWHYRSEIVVFIIAVVHARLVLPFQSIYDIHIEGEVALGIVIVCSYPHIFVYNGYGVLIT